MIRIDLGKDDIQGGSSRKKKSALDGIKLPPQLQAFLKKTGTNLGTLICVGTALAISYIGTLFGEQYKSLELANHAQAMKKLQDRLAVLAQEVEKFTPYKRELASYEEQKKLVSDRLTAVRQLLDSRSGPVNVLDTLGQSLPARTWLQTVDLSLAEAGALNIAGNSFSNEEISDFLDKLNASVYLGDVVLEDVGSRVENNVELRGFTISAKPKGNLLPGSSLGSAPTPGDRGVSSAPSSPSVAPSAPSAAPQLSAPPGAPPQAVPPGGAQR